MADQDIVLRDPGAGTGAISFGGGPAPVDGAADTALPALGAAATGALAFVGAAAVALQATAASATGALGFTGQADAALSAPQADGAGLLVFAGEAAVSLASVQAAATGALAFTGSAAVSLPANAASATGALAFVGLASPTLQALTASGSGTAQAVYTGTAAVSLAGLAASAAGALGFAGAGSAALPALAVDASGSVTSDDDDHEPGFISLSRPRALYELVLPAVASLYTITLARPMARLHIGDTALITGVTITDRDGAAVDPDTLTVNVLTPLGDTVELVYGTAPTTGSGDAIIRTAVGTFDVQIEITEERGAGVYRYTVVTTGARAAEPATFTVYARSA